jgi:hypothetical protein
MVEEKLIILSREEGETTDEELSPPLVPKRRLRKKCRRNTKRDPPVELWENIAEAYLKFKKKEKKHNNYEEILASKDKCIICMERFEVNLNRGETDRVFEMDCCGNKLHEKCHEKYLRLREKPECCHCRSMYDENRECKMFMMKHFLNEIKKIL